MLEHMTMLPCSKAVVRLRARLTKVLYEFVVDVVSITVKHLQIFR